MDIDVQSIDSVLLFDICIIGNSAHELLISKFMYMSSD